MLSVMVEHLICERPYGNCLRSVEYLGPVWEDIYIDLSIWACIDGICEWNLMPDVMPLFEVGYWCRQQLPSSIDVKWTWVITLRVIKL